MLGTAMAAIFPSSCQEKNGTAPFTFILDRRFRISVTERRQLTPWQRKVAHATPAMPMEHVSTKRMSIRMLAVEEKARKRKGVLESPSAEKMPVAIL